MKKLLLYSALALSMAFSSCSRDDNTNPQTPKGDGTVTVTVTLPDGVLADAGSRAMPSAYPGHKLRCILIVEENGAVTIRQEKLADEAQDGSFFFDITPESEDFKCSFWADYIKEDASATDGRYPDLYYNTESLPTVSYKVTGNELFNNDACDAFSLSLLNGATAGTMTRPLAKLSFTDERPATVAEAGSIALSDYKVYTDFNIVNGTVGDTPATLSYSGTPADAEKCVWFSNYLLVGNKNRLPGNFFMTAGANTHEVATDNVTLTANRPITASLNWQRANGIITVDVSFDDPDTPNVGDYYYSDGSWSTQLQTEKTVVGVVFATSETEAAFDSPGNYEGVTFEDGKVHAWVVALQDVSGSPRFVDTAAGASGATISGIDGIGEGESDIMGYANCLSWNTVTNPLLNGSVYSVVPKVVDNAYAESSGLTPPSTATDWYIPALGQMLVLRDVYLEDNSVIKASLTAAGGTELQVLNGTEVLWYWTSTARSNESQNQVYQITFHAETTSYYNGHSGGSGKKCRPILTF